MEKTAQDPPPVPNAGSTVYTPVMLAIYDFIVIHMSTWLVWRCPAQTKLLPSFAQNMSSRHLDIGVGTGYFPKKAIAKKGRKEAASQQQQHLTLVDLNPNALAMAKTRILAQHPTADLRTVLADAVQPLPSSLRDNDAGPFDSASLSLLLHCIPGGTEHKAQAIRVVKEVLSDDGVLFGSTVLGKQWDKVNGDFRPRQAQPWRPLTSWVLAKYNELGWFDNYADDPQVLDDVLRQHYRDVETEVVGMVFLFRAQRPIRNV